MTKTEFCNDMNLLEILPFYNVLIDFMEQTKVKKLTNVEFLNELPFYDCLTIREISEAFRRYARGFSIEIIDRKDPLVQLISSKVSIKNLFKRLLHELKGSKYALTMNITLSKDKMNDNTECASVYFNLFIKTVINHDFEYLIDKCFKEILYRIDNWISEGPGWVVHQINAEYLNISMYSPLSHSTYIELLDELNHPKKVLINIRNEDDKCFLWCHVRHLNLVDNHSARISKKDRTIAGALDYFDIDFPISEKDYSKIQAKNDININVFSYDNKTVYPTYVIIKILIFSGDRSHYVYIKDFDRLMFSMIKNKNKKHFCRRCLQCFSCENILIKHREDCLVINGQKSVKLGKGFIGFKKFSRQIPVPFKIYANFECILKEIGVVGDDFVDEGSSYTRKYQNHIPCGFGYKVVCIDDRFSKDIVVYRGKNCINKLISCMLDE